MRTLTLLVSLFLCIAAHAGDEDKFVSQTLGFEVTKPTSWSFMSANTYLEQMSQVRLSDEEYQEHFLQALRAPVVVITKRPSTYPGYNPSFKADVKPYGVIPKGSSGIEALEAMIGKIHHLAKEFRAEVSPENAVIGSKNGGYAKYSYVVTSSTGVDVPLTTEMWVVPLKSYVYIIGASYLQGSKDEPEEMKSIVQSIAIK